MLKLHKYDKAMLPAKRLYNRKPFTKVVFTDGKTAHVVTITNN